MIGAGTILNLLQLVGPAVSQTKEFGERFEMLIASTTKAEQGVLKEALADVQKGNDEGHARFQDKLAKAALKK